MKAKAHGITRRDFIRGAGCAAIGAAVALPVLAEDLIDSDPTTRVVLIRHPDAVDKGGMPNGTVLQEMLDDAMKELFETETPGEAFKKILKAEDVVGIKTNEWGYLRTPLELEQAIRRRALDVGVDEKNIAIDDRGVLRDPVFRRATALINARPLRSHAWSGVGSLIKNYIMFSPNPPKYHPNSCADLGALWDLPIVKGKTRLNILVLLTPLFHGVGRHHFDKAFTWPYRGLLVGTDPVALDTVGLHLFAAKRREYFGDGRPLKPTAHHVAIADSKFHIGTSDLKKIEIVKRGWQEGALI